MPFQKGNKQGGRPKGSKNKNTAEIRDMVLRSLEHRGGVKYLNSLEDSEFVKLLARVIPKEVDLNAAGGIELIVRDFTGATREAPKVIEAEAKEET